MRRAMQFAWLRVRREPGRTALGVLGVMAIGALLFDMLLLSNGLLVSFRERLDRSGFDVHVIAGESAVAGGPPIRDASAIANRIRTLAPVAAVQRLTLGAAEIAGAASTRRLALAGVDLQEPVSWTIVEGTAPTTAETVAPIVVNRNVARLFGLSPGSLVSLRGRCGDAASPLPIDARVVAIAEFQNDAVNALTGAMAYQSLARLCGDAEDEADTLLVASRPNAGPDATAAAIRTAYPALTVLTNDQIVQQFSRVGFSYFRQLSSVLSTVTLFFGLLLIAVLLTVSVNQRFGEIAALRALGLSRSRVMFGVLCESLILIGTGGALAVPAGGLLSLWLDAILRSIPGIPASAHFFVFTPHALLLHSALMAAGAVLAAIYPMRLVASLPIAATLRREVVS